MGIDPEKYRKMSVDGRWLAIALEIVRDNPGLTKCEVIAEASVFMPTFIDGGRGKKMGKVQLATRAANHKTFADYTFCVDGKLFAKPIHRRHKEGPTFNIVEHAKKHGVVRRREFLDVKNFSRLCDLQVCKGVLKKVSAGVYAINNDESEPV